MEVEANLVDMDLSAGEGHQYSLQALGFVIHHLDGRDRLGQFYRPQLLTL